MRNLNIVEKYLKLGNYLEFGLNRIVGDIKIWLMVCNVFYVISNRCFLIEI